MLKRIAPVPLSAALALGVAAGCTGSAVSPDDEIKDPRAETFDPSITACPIDPDAYIGGDASAYECPDFWVCDAIPGGKRCYTPGADYPDGGDWECWDDGGSTYCRGD